MTPEVLALAVIVGVLVAALSTSARPGKQSGSIMLRGTFASVLTLLASAAILAIDLPLWAVVLAQIIGALVGVVLYDRLAAPSGPL